MIVNVEKVGIAGLLVLLVAGGARAQEKENEGPMHAAATMGERLFLETRFAQFYFAHSSGDANATLSAGDPVLKPGPFAGQSMNCRACHLVDEFNGPLGNRTYCDFAPRSRLPDIGDGLTETPRNAATLVGAFAPRSSPLFLHADGQFATAAELIAGTLTGRDYGWRPEQYETAVKHIARIIREDDGKGALAKGRFGGGYSYSAVLGPTADRRPVSPIYRLNGGYILGDVRIKDPKAPGYVPDQQILQDVAALMEAYLDTLTFSQDAAGNFNGSPYDAFLKKNGLPRQPGAGQTAQQYGEALLNSVTGLANPQFVTDPADGHFLTHRQDFQFGAKELEGLRIFLTRPSSSAQKAGRVGNCVACHAPPAFTDFVFHNTGAAQEEYDALHGAGAFLKLAVPGANERDADLPATAQHPSVSGRFERPPSVSDAGLVDLGLWNVFANPDFPAAQAGLQKVLPTVIGVYPTAAAALPHTIGLFKTPSLRDLGQCEPYLHTGRKKTIEEVIAFYRDFSEKARRGEVRNADGKLSEIRLDEEAVAPLAAFLRALNEDYSD